MMRGAGRRSDAIYTFTAHRRAWLYTQPLDGGHRWARRHSTLRAVLTDPRPSAQQRDKRSTWCAAKSAGVLDRRTGTVSPGENMGGTAHPSMSTSRRGPSVFFSSSQAAREVNLRCRASSRARSTSRWAASVAVRRLSDSAFSAARRSSYSRRSSSARCGEISTSSGYGGETSSSSLLTWTRLRKTDTPRHMDTCWGRGG
jgi:hypothetical protein